MNTKKTFELHQIRAKDSEARLGLINIDDGFFAFYLLPFTFYPSKSTGPKIIYSIILQKGIDSIVSPLANLFSANIALKHVLKISG